ncbi:MAG: cytochrome d ubiquinol oxidase subunit II, partial [Actinobacteria bacterium]|nr:cytochrome d ubiquinol oxidase subunit II [Actinomycetota bacterium]
SITIGVLAVATSAYMAAVFLCGDATRTGNRGLAERFRARALAAAVVAGAAAAAGLAVLHVDAERIFTRLTQGEALPALVVSVLAGLATPALLWRRRYEPARYTAALAVAAIIAGWAVAQDPVLLPGLTIRQAAASHDTLAALVASVLAGGIILFPSLALLFRLTLRGTLRSSAAQQTAPLQPRPLRPGGVRLSVAFLVAGIGFLTVADAPWAHAIGVTCLFGFGVAGFRRLATTA